MIDIKEPRRGALGAADPYVVEQIVATVAGRVPVSAALGELRDGGGRESFRVIDVESREASDAKRLPTPFALPPGIAFAKLGLAGCGADNAWPARWRAAWAGLPPTCGAVAVVYADWTAAVAPPPRAVLREARAAGCRALLVDTWDKSTGGLLAHVSTDVLGDLLAAARDQGLVTVVAGSLGQGDLPLLAPLCPDYIGVRRAACRGGRDGLVDESWVRALVAELS